ncbi:MAG TPA: Mur ligase family protein, partial [Oligoflexia bacterium]|nr:Mur ligase family protein [Oligoflexia bacterium]
RFSPHIAVLLEIFPEHLDHHGTFEQYERAKLNITVNQRTNDFLVINKFQYKHPQLSLMTSANRVFFTEEPTTGSSVFLDNNCITIAQNGEAIPLLRADELRLLGRGNIRNTLAAVSVCSLCGVPSGHIAQELRNFEPLEHRLEYVGEFRGIKFYNDSLSTIPQAAINALDALKLDVATMILGGHDRGVDYTPLGPAVMESAVRTIILMPGSGERIWEAIRRAGNKADRLPRKFAVSSLEEAVRIAYQETPEGKTCLLSPASSSLNMFRDYRERGEIFRSCVRKFGLE